MKHTVKSTQSFNISDQELVDMLIKQMEDHVQKNNLFQRQKNVDKATKALKSYFKLK